MAISGFRHVPCGVPVNESERVAIERLKAKLPSTSNPWILLSNVNHSTSTGRLSDEIDQIVIGTSGVFVIEVKHWDSTFLKQRPEVAESEAERIYEKAKRVAGKLKSAFDPGFVSPRLLLTRGGTGIQANQRIQVRGVPVFGLTEWKELVNADSSGVLNAEQIERAAQLLVPSARIAISGDLRSFAGLVNLERQTSTEGSFHRIYRGQHPTRRDKVIMHLYDLSATDEKDPKNRAEREFQVIQRWQKSPYLPNLLDSFQEAEHYPGELYYFSLVDPAAPSLVDRAHDTAWGIDERLRFARESLLALAGFHQPEEESQPPLVHRHITPTTLRVRHNGRPLFTDFSLARLSDAQTISSIKPDFGQYVNFVAPEVLHDGLAIADARSDIFALCKTLMIAFTGDEKASVEANAFLEQGCATNPEGRESLIDLASVLERHTRPTVTPVPALPPSQYWDEDTIIPFQNSHYKIVGCLGGGGIGQTFKVVEVDDQSDELYGTYVAKLIYREGDAESALRAYRKARAYTIHPHLSAIHEIAPEWRSDRFAALLKWVEGMPLSDLSGILSLHAEELGETSLEILALRWLDDLCDALWNLHRVGLVHGDVSPRNIIVQGGEVVLTDYDTVADVGSLPRQRNPLYASEGVESGVAINTSDDIFSLAASIFHALFDKDPFLFGAQRVKNRGLNWEGVTTEGLNQVIEFLNRATSPVVGDRFDDARAAKKFLAASKIGDQDASIEPLAPVLCDQVVPRLAELLSAYPGSRHGNAETRGLDSNFAVETYVQTRLDDALRYEIENDKVSLVILFGNAGDGKTAFLQHLLRDLDLPDVHSRHRILERRLQDGRILKVNLDGSAAWQDKTANELLDNFFRPFHDLTFGGQARNPHVLAINSGKLLEWLETQDDTPLTDQLYRSLFDTDGDPNNELSPRIRLIDLNRRSLVGGVEDEKIGTEFLAALLNRFLGTNVTPNPWNPCTTCSAQHRCPAWKSVQALRDPVLGHQVRRRLGDALQACHLRGEVHITARELRAALVFIFFGVHDCTELHADLGLIPPGYWDRTFCASAPQRQGELLEELSRFDPALDSNPLLDRYLLRDAMINDKDTALNKKALILSSARRRAWFEWDHARYSELHLTVDSLPLFGTRHLERFRNVPLMTDDERTTLCRELCMGIARLEDLPPAAFGHEQGVPLRIQSRTPTESAFWVIKSWDRFRIEARLPHTSEGLEALHTRLLLIYRHSTGEEEILPVGLELFHLLLALKDGAQLAGTGQEGIFAHLEIFTQRLAQENARELYGWYPGEEDGVFLVRIEVRDGRQVLSREKI
jgi:serine/threonine protein kinase